MANEFVIKNGYFSQGNSNVTGSLQVTGSVGVTGSVSITENLTASKALISSSGNEQLIVIGSGSSSWITGIYGSQGNLLTITDTFSGSLFTVSDISGYPILDVTSDYYTSSINTIGFLNHTGSAGVTGSLIVSGGFKVYDTTNNFNIIDSIQEILYDLTGVRSVLWQDRILKDSSDGNSLVWGDRTLINSAGTTVGDWENRRFWDGTGNRSLDWDARLLYDSAATQVFDWSTPGQIVVNDDIIPGGPYVDNTSSFNLGSPTAAWDKIYVSNNSLHFVSGSVSASISFNDGIISFNNATVNIPTGSTVPTASFAQTASFLTPGTYQITSSWAQSSSQAITASYALTTAGGSNTSNIAAKYMGFGNNLTGSGLISASYNLYIPANTFTVGDVIRVNCLWNKPNGGTNTNFSFWITGSTTEFSRSTTGATQLASYNTTTNRTLGMSRLLWISSSTSTQTPLVTNGNLFSDEHGVQNAAGFGGTSSLNIDWTQDQWIIFAATNATAADLTQGYRFMATKV